MSEKKINKRLDKLFRNINKVEKTQENNLSANNNTISDFTDQPKGKTQGSSQTDEGEYLRQALMRLTSPQVEEIQDEMILLKQNIETLNQLEGTTMEHRRLLQKIQSSLIDIEEKFSQLNIEISDPEMVKQRLGISLIPTLHDQAREQGDEVAEALAPVIGSAIRHQIRNAKDDIIDALYPLIGQIIGKGLSEALRELTRNIDARLRRNLNFRNRINHFLARLRGVSEAELILRDSLPFAVEHVFLIHRDTGILIEHRTNIETGNNEMDTVSGMLTAIQDFVRDSFSGGEGDLEEVAHGDLRILLESGQNAYVAVVLSGIEPEGYNNLINEVVHEINLQHEGKLKIFNGNMNDLPDFKPILDRLLSFAGNLPSETTQSKPLARAQKRFVGILFVGIILLFALIIFACFYMIRLWPFVFPVALPSSTASVTQMATLIPSSTPTLLPTLRPTDTPTAIQTITNTPESTPTPFDQVGILSGNLNVRTEPSTSSPSLGVIIAGEKVVIIEQNGDWFLISRLEDDEIELTGWIRGSDFIEFLP